MTCLLAYIVLAPRNLKLCSTIDTLKVASSCLQYIGKFSRCRIFKGGSISQIKPLNDGHLIIVDKNEAKLF